MQLNDYKHLILFICYKKYNILLLKYKRRLLWDFFGVFTKVFKTYKHALTAFIYNQNIFFNSWGNNISYYYSYMNVPTI